MPNKQFWIGVISLEHVHLGVSGGFIQLNHGKKEPLEKLHGGDGFVFYSPKTSYPDGSPVQMFTAIGTVKTGTVYQGVRGPDAFPWRLDVQYLDSTPVPIRDLLDKLSFIPDKTHWGAPFRFGNLRIPAQDFKIIAEAMGRDFGRDFGAQA